MLVAHAVNCRFQSTLPARGATMMRSPISADLRNFNPRSPHGERHAGRMLRVRVVRISIHAPRTGSDHCLRSTPCRSPISIHAPRTGSDLHVQPPCKAGRNFNPRSPHGERRIKHGKRFGQRAISIHAPRTGSDAAARRRRQSRAYFNPRSPHGERPGGITAVDGVGIISIHAPRTGSDKRPCQTCH